jgi:hypothetical protein
MGTSFFSSWLKSSAPRWSVRRGAILAGALAASSTLSPAASAGDDGSREFHGYGIEVFDQIGDACDGGNLNQARNQAHNYYEVFDDWTGCGDWGVARYYEDDEVDGRDFTDPTGAGACSDYQPTCTLSGADGTAVYGADAADVVFLSTHGGFNGGDDSVRWSMGDEINDCSVASNSGTGKANMYWNADAEIVIVDACNSGRFAIWDGSFAASPNEGITNMLDPNGTMNTLLAYHGVAPDRSWGKNYAEDVYSDGLGEDWVIEGTDWGNMEDNQDTCTVAIIFGDDAADREHLYEWGGFDDREATGNPTLGSTYFYMGGCDPVGANPVSP